MHDGTKLTREFEIDLTRGAVNEKARTVELSFSSEAPVERWFGTEVLDHSPGAVDLSRLNGSGALLVDHDTADQVGVVEEARIGSDRKGRAKVRFSKGARAQEIFQDVVDGIRKLISVGYRITESVKEEGDNGDVVVRATAWTPLEISLVSVPADVSVGIGRSAVEQTPVTIMNEENSQILTRADRRAPLQQDYQRQQERERQDEIMAIAKQFGQDKREVADAAQRFIDLGSDAGEMRHWVLRSQFNAKPIDAPNGDELRQLGDIGMSDVDVRRWSLTRALNAMANKRPVDGLEKEASNAVAKLCRHEPEGLFIPNEIVHGTRQQRALSATGGGAVGGYTVQTDVLGSSLIELLRNLTVCFELGARKLGGLVGDVAIPSQSGGAAAYWVAENQKTDTSNLTFGQVGLTPHRLSAVTVLSKRLVAQSSVDVEGLVREDLARVLAIALDLAGLAGTGVGGQPLGVMATPGIGSVTFGAAATWAKMLEFEQSVANANALIGTPAYVCTPNVRAKLRQKTKVPDSTYPVFVWGDDNRVAGYRTAVTKQVTGDKVIFGNWADLVIADWIGMDVVVDPYTLADQHQIKVAINMLADVGIRHMGSFAVSTDSGAQ